MASCWRRVFVSSASDPVTMECAVVTGATPTALETKRMTCPRVGKWKEGGGSGGSPSASPSAWFLPSIFACLVAVTVSQSALDKLSGRKGPSRLRRHHLADLLYFTLSTPVHSTPV